MGHVRREGLTLLSPSPDFPSKKSQEIDCNIVFIHGLRGHPRTTWATKPERQHRLSAFFRPRSKSASRERRSPSPSSSGTAASPDPNENDLPSDVFWPEDLLPTDLPSAAIYTYGYDADLVDGYVSGASKNSVFQNSKNFMIDIASDIENNEPIIFVAHSLGGIIVKDMLHRSKTSLNPSYQRVHKQTYAVIFLGTPHRGSQISGWGEVFSNVAALAGIDVSKKLLQTLSLGSDVLDIIQEDFIKMLYAQDFKVHTFKEGQGVSGTKKLSSKVVSDFSSGVEYALEDIEVINANHMQMARFSSKDDNGYRKILRTLKGYVEEINTLAASDDKSVAIEQLTPVYTGSTKLHVASQEGQATLVEHLLSQGERIEAMDSKLRTPLHRAAQFGRGEVVYLLLKNHANKYAQDNTGMMPINLASAAEVLWLLKNGHEHSALDLSGDTFLHWLIKSGAKPTESIEWALNRGYNVNFKNGEDNTPLICAVKKGSREVTQLLINHGATLNARDMEGHPPLILAAQEGHYDLVKLLLDHKVPIEEPGPNINRRALFMAACNGHSQVVRLLLSRSAKVDQRDNEQWTELGAAAARGHFDIVQQLVEAGADVNDKASPVNRHLPLPEASHWWHTDVMRYLLEKGADVELRGRMHGMFGGETMLIAAARARRYPVCEVLLKYGADTEYRDSGGNTAVDAAREAGDEAVVQLLLEYRGRNKS